MSDPTAILHLDDPEPALAVASERHPGISFFGCDSYDGLSAKIDETGASVVYSVRFAGTQGFPREALVENGQVKWVSVGGSGTDHLHPWVTERVTVTNAAGVAAGMMAEYAIGCILNFSLDLPGFRRAQAERRWVAGRVTPIEGQTLLIVGLGQTGQAIAARASTLGVRVIGLRARPSPVPHVETVLPVSELDAVLPVADAIAICVPLLESTRGLIGRGQIGKMKTGAVLVDVSRGGVVDQAALADALRSGHLKGAALDVFETEPLPPESPFWEMENVIVTPHCSSVYDGWELKSVEMFCDNLTRYRAGQPLMNLVDPERGY